jgi:hypothetical protein
MLSSRGKIYQRTPYPYGVLHIEIAGNSAGEKLGSDLYSASRARSSVSLLFDFSGMVESLMILSVRRRVVRREAFFDLVALPGRQLTVTTALLGSNQRFEENFITAFKARRILWGIEQIANLTHDRFVRSHIAKLPRIERT